MAQKKKKSSGAKTKKKPRRSNPGNPGGNPSHGMLTLPRGTMLVPVGAAKRPKKRKGGSHPKKTNPEPPPHHAMLKNGAAAVGFGTLAATVGMLGGFALSKANIKNKWANVAANVATGAIVGGGVGMLDRAAGTVTAHNYMVAAGQWAMTPSQSQGQQQQTRQLSAAGASAASPQMLRATAPAMHGTDDDISEPPAEAIAPPRPNPGHRRPARQLHGYRGVSGLGSPLDHLGDGDELAAYEHVSGLGSPLDHLGGFEHLNGVMADDVGSVMADDVGGPLDHLGDGDELGDDVEGFEHLNGIMADDVGDDLDGDDFEGAVIADDIGDDELAAAAMDDMD